MSKDKIYTIGYTLFLNDNHVVDVERIFETLKRYGVTHLIDVRSVPFSKQYPQCNSNCLDAASRHFGIRYVHMPEIGAKANPEHDVYSKASEIMFDNVFPIAKSIRPEKTELLADDYIVDFGKFRNDEDFVSGLKRIEKAYENGCKLALMCSEKDPVDCHRYFLISKALEKRFGSWLEVLHIAGDSLGNLTLLSNSDLNKRLEDVVLKRSDVQKLNLFSVSLMGPAPIDNYYGDSQQEKVADFCDRYWNIIHGWKKIISNNNFNAYD